MRLLIPALLALAATASAVLPPRPAMAADAPAAVDQAALKAALADPRRDADRARDVWRHPAETLTFFRVAPGMTVVDYLPSAGWYTQVLVPYLGEKGRYMGFMRPRPGADGAKISADFVARAMQWTGAGEGRITAFPADAVPAETAGTVDRVLIFREMHNMLRNGWLYPDLKAARTMLKPNGLLGVVQHRAKPNAPADYTDGSKGYLREKDVIALIEAQGFELVAKSEINANPADPANWPDGVWTLPPAFTLGDKDRARYAAVGESDRMTLLFRKRP